MANKFSMKTFNELLIENRSLVFPLSEEQFRQLKEEAKDTNSLVKFFEKNVDFPASNNIGNFIKLLNTYNGKVFDNWMDYISLKFEDLQLDDNKALIFNIAIDADLIDVKSNIMYRRWWKTLKFEKPIVIFYIKKQLDQDKLFKVINKKNLNRDRKEDLTKSIGGLIKKKEKLGQTEKTETAGEAIGEPEKGIDYLIKKKEARSGK